MSLSKRKRWALRCIAFVVYAILYIPLLALVTYSFLARDPSTGTWEWTLRWYRESFHDAALRSSLWISFQVGLGCTVGATILGVTTALALERSRLPGKKLMDAFTLLPLVVPEIVFGLSLLIWFVFLKLTLGTFSMILAHITFSFSYVLMTVRTRLKDFDPSLEEAAFDLGASAPQTFFRVTLPLLTPAIISGAAMAFTISFDDFLVSFFTSGVGNDTFPIQLYGMIKFGLSPKVNALSTLILAATIFVVILTLRPRMRSSQGGAKSQS